MFPWNLFPFNKELQKNLQHMKPDEINQYVQKAMEQMGNIFHSTAENYINSQKSFKGNEGTERETNGPSSGEKNNKIKYSVYETHDFIFVRILIKEEKWLQQLRLYYTSNLLIIEHIPEIGDKLTIPLPALVKKKGSSAHYKDETLEIKIIKNIDLQFSEIEITEGL